LEHVSKKFIVSSSNKTVADADLHLVFLFASPLVMREPDNTLKPIALLEFKREFNEIKDSLKECKRQIRIKSRQATVENLTQILT
jgi:hypothetical protein